MKSIYLPKLMKISISKYSFYEQQPSFEFNFNDGISAIIGANGVGKTTFINMIIYCLVGYKKDMKGRKGNKKIVYKNEDYFKNRINNNYEEEFNSKASVTLIFKLDTTIIQITRSLIKNEILLLKIDDKVFEDTSFEAYGNIICRYSNIPFFKDFELIIREFLLFDESRENVSWEIDTQGEILRILLLDNDFYTKYTELQDKITTYDSKGRQASENQRMAEAAYKDLIRERENLKNIVNIEEKEEVVSIESLLDNKLKFSNEVEELKDNVGINNKLISELVSKNDYLSSDIERIKIEIEQIDEELEKCQSKLYSSHYDKLPDYYYTIEQALSKNGECLICGAKSKELKEENNLRIRNNKCLICSSDLNIEDSVDENLIGNINKLNKDKKLNINKFENIDKLIQSNYTKINKYKQENEQYLKRTNCIKNELILIDNELSERNINEQPDTYSTILNSKKDLISKLEDKKKYYYDLRTETEKEFKIYIKQFKNTIDNLNNSLSNYFNKYAKTFIGWNCELTVQTKIIKKMPHHYYLPLVDESIRENPEAVSESQRFFLDQAFRMAIINFMQDNIPNFSTFFITETPEGSLDLIYEAQVAEMFLKFAQTNNNIIFTSNLNSSSFLNKLFDRLLPNDIDNRILNLLGKSKMSDLQKEKKPVLDSLIEKIYGGNMDE
ncbi:chromosome partitioning protein ParA [Clostridium botulinum]|uniref:AAA family ATPase n=1 Tax=Clostridium botulinum TaxID=1491 RepID=UPI000772F14F|nr:AAA family ATPase [Clostridium botulinum]NFI41184.1 chromosome partitioning protein ParA [Clostridium botulinum]NFI75849.1 chromosome partitioning protein ParA [Clostridium botulinum]NFJ36352.1 chromosome partitioning protein ParA [Clostridium botulinum]